MAIGAILGQRSGVQTVNNQLPDGNGNVNVTAESIEAMSTSGGTFTGSVNMGGNTLSSSKTPSAQTDVTNKQYVDGKVDDVISVAQNKAVQPAAFYQSGGIENYPWRASISIPGVTVNSVPEVIFGVEDATSGLFAPVCDSYAGGVYIYANSKPTKQITIPTIVLREIYTLK